MFVIIMTTSASINFVSESSTICMYIVCIQTRFDINNWRNKCIATATCVRIGPFTLTRRRFEGKEREAAKGKKERERDDRPEIYFSSSRDFAYRFSISVVSELCGIIIRDAHRIWICMPLSCVSI